ncbi:MAG: uL15 family ribosomal protein [Nanoarchaeota archaeon]
MVTNHRKKNSRHRGSWTSGHGEKKKRRGAGHRGGRGAAGSGKRGDAKKPRFWKNKKLFGKHGFFNPKRKDVKTVTIAKLNADIERMVSSGIASKEGETYKIDLSRVGVNKLLGTGYPLFVFDISVKNASQNAVRKIEEKGGSVSVASDNEASVSSE